MRASAIASSVRDVAVQHAIAHGIGQRHVPVVSRRMSGKLGLLTVQVVDQRFGNRVRTQPGAHVLCISQGVQPATYRE